MMTRPSLLVMTLTAATLIAACGSADAPEVADAPAPAEARQHPGGKGGEGLMVASELTAHAQQLYIHHCASCHEGGVPYAPHSVTFQMQGPEAILASMVDGVMAPMSTDLSYDDKVQLAEFLGGRALGAPAAQAVLMCAEDRREFDRSKPPALDGWGMTLTSSRFASDPGFSATEIPSLKLKWAFAYPNATRARSQPMVAGGAVFVGGQSGEIYALDFETGCARWIYQAEAEVRSSISIDGWDPEDETARPRAYFGDFDGWVYAVDAFTGEEIWKSHIDDHAVATITGSPRLHRDRLYVPISSTEWASANDPAYECCTFRGAVAAFDTHTGEMLWKTHSIAEAPQLTGETNSAGARQWHPAGAPIWNSPTIDERRNLLYVGTGQAYTSPAADTSNSVLAMDLDTGELKWHWQAEAGDAWTMACFLGLPDNCPEEDGPDLDIGAPPILLTLSDGREIILAGRKSATVYALDPDNNGELLWTTRLGVGGYAGGVHWGMAAEPDILYAPNADTDFLGTFEEDPVPGLFALDARTGDTLWYAPAPDVCPDHLRPACDPGFSAAVTAMPGAVFAGGFDGHLRAYDSASGELLWDFDTKQTFETVSGEQAHGGAIESDGPVIANGRVLVNSGYLFGGRLPGNVLLVFGPAEAASD